MQIANPTEESSHTRNEREDPGRRGRTPRNPCIAAARCLPTNNRHCVRYRVQAADDILHQLP